MMRESHFLSHEISPPPPPPQIKMPLNDTNTQHRWWSSQKIRMRRGTVMVVISERPTGQVEGNPLLLPMWTPMPSPPLLLPLSHKSLPSILHHHHPTSPVSCTNPSTSHHHVDPIHSPHGCVGGHGNGGVWKGSPLIPHPHPGATASSPYSRQHYRLRCWIGCQITGHNMSKTVS